MLAADMETDRNISNAEQQTDDQIKWEIIDQVMQSRDSAMSQIAEKNVELFGWLVKVKQEYAKLKDLNCTFKDSDAKLKARVIRLEQELIQLRQSEQNPPRDKNLKQAAAATENEETKEPVAKKQRKKRKKAKVSNQIDNDDDLTFLDAIIEENKLEKI